MHSVQSPNSLSLEAGDVGAAGDAEATAEAAAVTAAPMTLANQSWVKGAPGPGVAGPEAPPAGVDVTDELR